MSEEDRMLKRQRDRDCNLTKRRKIKDMNHKQNIRVRKQGKLRTNRYREKRRSCRKPWRQLQLLPTKKNVDVKRKTEIDPQFIEDIMNYCK